jgi:hypothetical protein
VKTFERYLKLSMKIEKEQKIIQRYFLKKIDDKKFLKLQKAAENL